MVLLSNRNGVLPITQAPRRIAVLGPLADNATEMLGPWSGAGRGEEMVSLLDGLRKTWPQSEIKYARGVDIDSEDLSGIPAAFELARQSDLVILCVGEARQMSGEAGCRARPGLPGKQAALADAVLDTGKPVVALLSCGRPLAVSWLFERAERRARHLVSRQRGRQRRRRRAERPLESLGPPAGLLAGRCRADPRLLLAPAHRPSLRRQLPLHQQVSRHPERAAVPVRPRPVLHPLQAAATCAPARPSCGAAAA